MLADNKLALNADWDPDLLAQELQELIDMTLPKLEALVLEGADACEASSSRKRLSGEDYASANRKCAPLIKSLGFRSLRHMETYGERLR